MFIIARRNKEETQILEYDYRKFEREKSGRWFPEGGKGQPWTFEDFAVADHVRKELEKNSRMRQEFWVYTIRRLT